MNKSDVNNKNLLITALFIFFADVICQMPSMIKSGFLMNFSKEIILSCITLVAFIFVVFKIFNTKASLYTATFTSVLLFANWAQLLLFYACNSQETDDVMKKVISFTIIVLVTIIATCFAFVILNEMKKYKNVCFIIFSIIAIGTSLFILLFSGANSNTSATKSGFQPAIIAMFFILYAFAGSTSGNFNLPTRIAHLVIFWILMSSMVIKHEMGIPVMSYIACMIMYFFFNKSKKELWFILTNIIIPIVGLGFIMIISPSIRTDTINKLFSRIMSENEHWYAALANLKASSLFGSENYDVFLAEASTDYSLNNAIHYWGFLYGVVAFIAFVIMSISFYKEVISTSNDNIVSNLKKLSYCAIFIITVYNILDNISGFPIIGLQLICSGTSKTMAILSGLLMGSIIADPLKIKNLMLSALEKTGIISETCTAD